MVEHFELGGKMRPMLFGGAAFKLMKERKGITMGKFLEGLNAGEIDGISDIAYCALRIGERYERVPAEKIEKYDELDVAMWMDIYPGGAMVFMEKLLKSLPQPSSEEAGNEPGEAQTTGTGTN